MAGALAWLFGDRVVPDIPSDADAAGLPLPEAAPSAAGRRDRTLDGGDRVWRDAVAQKILLGWLQNRHQTLYPLTVNLRSLDAGRRQVLAGWMAVAMLAGQVPDAAQIAEARAWFGKVGADDAMLDAWTRALAEPPALSLALESVIEFGLSAYAYVLALVALDPLDLATPPFLDYVAARLALPTLVVRSATRRYRR